MSAISTKNATDQNNELVLCPHEDIISENPWVVGVSKTHPGLKYYFNKITGVSLWNISREDMVRAKQSLSGIQPQYINCPEPEEPPPSKRAIISTSTHCDHVSHHSKQCNKQLVNYGFARESLGHACNMMYTSRNTQPNVITVNVQPYPNPTCMSQHNNISPTIPRSQINSSLAVQDNVTFERNHFNINLNSELGNKRFMNTNIADMVQGSSNVLLHNQSSPDSEFFDDTSQFETVDLAPLKRFTQANVKDKWYIIADANVYLHHIKFLKSLMYSDNQCSLMVPQNVKPELESDSKGPNRAKAYYALYYIYKMCDRGFALIDGDNSEQIKNKSNEKDILDCCSKLKDQNYYVVVISNDLELQKYRNKMYQPIFTVAQLKEYLYKSDNSVTTESSEPTLNFSQFGKSNIVSVPNNQSMNYNIHNVNTSTMTDTYETVKRNQNVQTSPVYNVTGTQVHFQDLPKRTTDAEVQTSYPLQSEDITDTAYGDKCLPHRNNEAYKGKETVASNTPPCESTLRSGVRSSGIKLRRKKFTGPTDPNLSSKLVSVSDSRTNTSNTLNISTANDNSSLNRMLEQQCNISNINDNSKHKEITESTQEQKETNKNSTIGKIHDQSESININETLKMNQSTILQSNAQTKNTESKNVMFEVCSDVMDQSLRSKSDEWLSRFVQIMEEGLTQVLRKNTSLYLPPPWNMCEAAMCVGKMYKDDEDIADASKRFLDVLKTISDDKGNINTNISPTQYMEMYSFGVYMVDALQGMFSTCEDLQAASESLAKLLSDIQDSEADISNIDSFQYTSQDENLVNHSERGTDDVEVSNIVKSKSLSSEKETTETMITNNEIQKFKDRWSNNSYNIPKDCECNINTRREGNTGICTKTATTSIITSPVSSRSYNLSTRRKRMSLENQEEPTSPPSPMPQQVVRNEFGKNTFLSNFRLQRKILQNTNNISEQKVTKNVKNDNGREDVHPLSHMEINQGLNSNAPDLSHNSISTDTKPRIVRNFVMCSEFEDRLRKRHVHNEIEDLYFDNQQRPISFMDTDENSCDTGRLHIDEYTEFHDNDYSTEQEINFTVDFKHFIKKIGQEIQELSTEVYSFSKNACESLSTLDDKNDIREKALELHLHIDKLCIALTNLLDRDKNGGYNLRAMLRNTEFYDILVEEDQLKAYGGFIAQCMELAGTLRSTVTDVLTASCEV